MWKFDKKNRFAYSFNPKTGAYIRTGIIDENGHDTGKDPFMASFPHLIDVGIMGHCIHGQTGLCKKAGIECYQSGLYKCEPNMSLEDFEKICVQCAGKVQQFALGGRGDPDQHENFKEILETCSKNGIVPNFTTSGFGMTENIAKLCKKHCGAVAVSMYSRLIDTVPFVALRKRDATEEKIPLIMDEIPIKFTLGNIYPDCINEGPNYLINHKNYKWDELHHITEQDLNGEYELYKMYNEKQEPNYTMQAIQMLINAGVKTNIHYVLNTDTIDEAIIRLKHNGFPKGINAVIFLLHKPAGLGTEEKMLNNCMDKVVEFFTLIDNNRFNFKIGFDSCTVPGLLNFTKNTALESVDTCEGGRYSCYIGANMNMVPCSFDQRNTYVCDLNQMTIQEAWDSNVFEQFRAVMKNSCPNCDKKEYCMGGCPLMPKAVLCDKKH